MIPDLSCGDESGSMNDNELMSASHAVYVLRLPIVFATKYRRQTLTPELLDAWRNSFIAILADWRCALIEFGGEADMSLFWWVSIRHPISPS